MIHSVLEDDGLFGVLNVDPVSKRPVVVGSSAEILEVQRLPDGRMNILTIGRQRFRVLEFKYDRPYIVGLVECFEDDAGEGGLDTLAGDMTQLLKDVVRLSAKLVDKQIEFPNDLPSAPLELSFWVAGSFPGLPEEQQSLLEIQDTAERLRRESDILRSALKQLAARTALKDAFQ